MKEEENEQKEAAKIATMCCAPMSPEEERFWEVTDVG